MERAWSLVSRDRESKVSDHITAPQNLISPLNGLACVAMH